MAGRPRTRVPRTSATTTGPEPSAPVSPATNHDPVSRETEVPKPEAPNEIAQPTTPEPPSHPGRGRPTKFDPSLLALAEKCGRAGLIDEQIAQMMGVATATYYTWLKQHPEFLEALKRGQTDKRARLRTTMFQRAIGRRVTEVKTETRDGKVVAIHTTERDIAPSDTMLIFLACNEMPEEYKHVQHIQQGGSVDLHLKDTVPAPMLAQMNQYLQAMGEAFPKATNGHKPAPAPKREMAKAGQAKTSLDFEGDDEDFPLPTRTRGGEEFEETQDPGPLDISELEAE